jgi:catechol 2,3-dioxygenase-like lactoylglutathione lyase family enzyme
MIDHIGIEVTDVARSVAFYERALAPLGYKLVMRFQPAPGMDVAGFGVGGKPDFWLANGRPDRAIHVAFHADKRSIVTAFHAAAMAAGGVDNGAPGPRPIYHEHYYGAFVKDPDGHNVEAVCHEPYLG